MQSVVSLYCCYHQIPQRISTKLNLTSDPVSSSVSVSSPVNHSVNQQMAALSRDGYLSERHLAWRKLQLSRAKIKATAKTSALLAGFAMVALVEIQLTPKSEPEWLIIAFAVCTTLLVAVHSLALMISTCMLPNIEAVSSLHSAKLSHQSPHQRLHWYIEGAWFCSNILGLVLFLLEIALLCATKFWKLSAHAAWSGIVIIVPVLILFVIFALHFYITLVKHKYELTASSIEQLEGMKELLDEDMTSRGNKNLMRLASTVI